MSDFSAVSEELVVEILCRVGFGKEAFQCKSVCKQWCSLVNTHDSYFLRRWRHINCKRQEDHIIPLALISRHPFKIKTTMHKHLMTRHAIDYCASANSYTQDLCNVNLNFLPNREETNDKVCILSSCKDLLLCSVGDSRCYYVCNPFTKQWTALPRPPRVSPPERPHAAKEDEGGIKVGFVVCGGDEFKLRVVRAVPYSDAEGKKVHISIFSSDDKWTSVGDKGGWRDMFTGRSIYKDIVWYKGRLVWFMKPDSTDLFEVCVSLFKWNLSDLSYSRLPLPPGYWGSVEDIDRAKSTIGACEGRLRVAQFVDFSQKLTVWELDDGGEGWEVVLELDLRGAEAEEGCCKDWRMARSSHECEEGFKVRTKALVFHPYERDTLYMVTIIKCDTKEDSAYIFKCNIGKSKTRVEVIREIPSLAACNRFLPLVPHSWPTPLQA